MHIRQLEVGPISVEGGTTVFRRIDWQFEFAWYGSSALERHSCGDERTHIAGTYHRTVYVYNS